MVAWPATARQWLPALIGIYGAIAYSVAQRTRELGIRQAIGAQRSDILRHVLKQGLVVATAAGYIPVRRATRIDPMAALRVG